MDMDEAIGGGLPGKGTGIFYFTMNLPGSLSLLPINNTFVPQCNTETQSPGVVYYCLYYCLFYYL